MKGDVTDDYDQAALRERGMTGEKQHLDVLTIGNTALNLSWVILMRQHYIGQTVVCYFHTTSQC